MKLAKNTVYRLCGIWAIGLIILIFPIPLIGITLKLFNSTFWLIYWEIALFYASIGVGLFYNLSGREDIQADLEL